MSLRVKIRKQARLAIEIVRYLRNSIGKAAEIAEQEKWIQVDVVSGLLDKAITEIEAKAFRHGVNYWENVVWFDDVRKILLGAEGETKK